MIIENPDAFKSWLTSILEPLCDADPAALAKYVYALVKKDKPLGELREGMIDQLDVFLQHETKPFVDMLFKALETQEYLKGAEQLEPPPLPPPPPTEEPEPPVEEAKAPPPPLAPPTNGTTDTSPVSGSRSPSMGAAPRHRVVLTRTAKHAAPAPPPPPPPPPCLSSHRPHMEQTLVKAALPLTELLEEPVDQPPRRRDRRNDVFREKEERRRRRSRSWERRGGGGGGGGGGGAGVPPRRRAHRDIDHERRHDKRRLMSRSPSPRRYRNRSPPSGLEKNSRSRSRSPIGGRDRDRDRDRLRVERDHRERVSRDRERSRERSRDRSRDRSMSPRPDSRIEHNDRYKRRCRDFDEKGYCMRGDLCQWDHGADPVVLEDAALSRLLPPPPPGIPAEYNPLAPDIWMAAGGPAPGPYGPMPTLPPRALVPIPRVRHEVPPPLPMGPGGPPLMPLPPRHQAPPKKQFDYNRLGGRGVMTGGPGCSLEVRKVPRGMNDITHLNNHFSKFGKIVNIQVCYENDPEGALITFASPVEANVAYKSTEAVLNNRFIKLFWHNPENKQENVAPPAGGPNNKQNNNSTGAHHNSHNKVLINKDNIKASADIRKAEKQQTALEANPTTNSTEKPAPIAPASGTTNPTTTTNNTTTNNTTSTGGRKVLVLEMHKRAQALLETQLQQQTLLIQRLESGNVTGPQKAALLEAISSAQEGIEKLRKELVAYNNAIRQMQEERMARALSKMQLQAKRPKTREEAQKEILDAELDMFTKQQEGQDVTELAKKISELRRQMAVQFPHPASRRPLSRGGRINPAMRLTRVGGATTNKFNNQVVDHRPKALRVSGFEPDDLPQLVTHFAQFGEITGKEVDLAVPELVVAFKTRAAAEQAAARTRHYNDRTLSITWVTSNKPVGGSSVPASNSSTTPTSNGPTVTNSEPETPKEGSEDALLRFEEEEEEEREDRSWRR